jgi:two-component system sensor histidine kinase KdpD
MNVQHLESLNDQMREITGIQVRETIPDWVVKEADQIILIDLPPRALLNRLQRGAVYGPDKAERAMENFFKESTLAALREMALRQTAHEIDVRQRDAADLDAAPADPRPNSLPSTGRAELPERILIHLTESLATAGLIRRGRRVADYLKADCFAVSVLASDNTEELPKDTRQVLEQHLEFARKLHIETRVLEGRDEAEALVDFARRNGVTQIFLSKPPKRLIPWLNKKHTAMRVVHLGHAGDGGRGTPSPPRQPVLI